MPLYFALSELPWARPRWQRCLSKAYIWLRRRGQVRLRNATLRAMFRMTGIFAVDYRVAPEYPFPAAVNDAYNAFRHIVEHGTELGGDTSRIVVLGASAGGNFAAVVCRKAKEGWFKR